jgi:membrane carboxypeptidase/penicillin-binding protein
MPRVEEAVTPEVAYMMNHVLKGVIDRGTAASARSQLEGAFAGKTGTMDNYTDAWFIGYSPSLACGVWVGFTEEMRTLGRDETGARAALPIWTDFFLAATEGREPEEFEIPPNIVFRRIDYKTGLLAVESCPKKHVIYEAFIRGTEPVKFCSPREDYLISLPWTEQKKLLMEDPLPPPYITEKTPREKAAFPYPGDSL